MALTKVTSALTNLDGGITIDNITIDGTEIDLSSGSLTIDVADNIVLDTDGGNIALKDNGTQFGNFANNGGDFEIDSNVQDKDIKFNGNDGGSTITAGFFDMSDGGKLQIGASSVANLNMGRNGDVIEIKAKKDGTDGIALTFHTQDSGGTTGERMRILANGGIFMQKTGHAFATVGNEFFETGKSNHTVDGDTVMNLHRKSSHGVVLEFFKDSGSVGSISTNSNSLPSDRNFKRDISDLNLGLNLINKLKPSQYNYKLDDEDCPKMYGLIAQDLEESLTEVGVEKNSTWLLQHNPKDDEKQSDYALDYLKLTPVLIKAIQELSAKVEELESKINE